MSLRRFYRGSDAPRDLSQVPEVLSLTVDSIYDGWRLDHYLVKHLPWTSRTDIQSRIRRKLVRKNGQAVASARRVRKGDTIELDIPPPTEDMSLTDGLELETLYEDDWYLAINKPANLLVHPVGRRRFTTVINVLHAKYRDLENPRNDVVPMLCHRIDQQTTGLLLVAKGKKARSAMYRQFVRDGVTKEYLALVEGHVEPAAGLIDLPIGVRRHEIHFALGINIDDGQSSQSMYRVEQRLPGFDLVRVRLITGRQHQVRLHFEALGHPLVGDAYYGVRRQLLASKIEPTGQPPQPQLPSADELFAEPDALPRITDVNPDWRFRMTMIPTEGPDPWAEGIEETLLARPGYQEAIPAQRPIGFHPDPDVLIDRVALHAARMRFRHPMSGARQAVDVAAPLPADIAEALRVLGPGP